MIARCSRVGILICLVGIFVIFCPKVHVSPSEYFWLHTYVPSLRDQVTLAVRIDETEFQTNLASKNCMSFVPKYFAGFNIYETFMEVNDLSFAVVGFNIQALLFVEQTKPENLIVAKCPFVLPWVRTGGRRSVGVASALPVSWRPRLSPTSGERCGGYGGGIISCRERTSGRSNRPPRELLYLENGAAGLPAIRESALLGQRKGVSIIFLRFTEILFLESKPLLRFPSSNRTLLPLPLMVSNLMAKVNSSLSRKRNSYFYSTITDSTCTVFFFASDLDSSLHHFLRTVQATQPFLPKWQQLFLLNFKTTTAAVGALRFDWNFTGWFRPPRRNSWD
ncbi:hypothetical protein DVH24_033912 [Malus domestica]|uniref:Uncharacterized protein n=1 Tax=Malus domestica TaxID=3750 RepID=A0A498KU87_MALDO|nr:hypothetical protein DVH24_033912 [Malus domestica]